MLDTVWGTGANGSAKAPGNGPRAVSASGPPVTILLVEADPKSAAVIREWLAGHGDERFRVDWVTTLADALKRLNYRDVDVVLVGTYPPGDDGMEPFDWIRQAKPDALVLPLSNRGLRGATTVPSPDDAHDPETAMQRDAAWLADTLRYVTRRKRAEAVLRTAETSLFEEKEHAQVILRSIGDAVLVTDLNGLVTYLNPVAETMTGWRCGEAIGRPLAEVFPITNGATGAEAADPARRAMRENRTVDLEADCVLRRRDGSESGIEDSAAPLHDRHGRVSGAVIVFRDVSQSRAVTRRMAYLANHDALTGLPNRTLLNERLDQSIRLADRHGKQVALLYVDLDYFKDINDSLGHTIGDLVLQAVAQRLTSRVRASDTVCRHGGDEFVILLTEISHPDDATHVANELLEAFSSPIEVNEHTVHIALSIGISIYPDHGDSADALMEYADHSMYRTKSIARTGNDTSPNPGQAADSLVENDGRAELRRALDKGEFLLHYQPQIDVTSGRIIGVEALVRWLHPERGLIYPQQFMGLAEQTGLIVPIGHWVIREACRQINAWKAADMWAPLLSVNVSALEFGHTRFTMDIEKILDETGLEPAELELELTEGVLMRDADASVTRLHDLRDLGLHLAVDNFGAGPSSLGHLRRFPVHTLKVDGSFVHNVDTTGDNAVILRSLIGLGKSLKHRVVAEGVETVQQYGFVKAQHCDAAQGFQLGHPLAAADCALLLASRRHVLRDRQA